MTPESSPFRPGQPVPARFFVGRVPEIERLRGLVRTSIVQRRVTAGFVTGERGIGKSTLAGFVRRLTEREDGAMGCHVHLGGARNLRQMLREVYNGLLRTSCDRPWYRRLGEFFGDRVRAVGPFGAAVELELRDRDLATIERRFAESMSGFVARIAQERKSLFLILDDIDRLAGSPRFAPWFKSVVDGIAASDQQMPLCILMVGLEESRREMMAVQLSAARIFDLIDIAPWSVTETAAFYRAMFDKGGAAISPRSLAAISRSARGLPALAHEIGDAVWRTARGPAIGARSIRDGSALGTRIAALRGWRVDAAAPLEAAAPRL